jgi:hypothetical protein
MYAVLYPWNVPIRLPREGYVHKRQVLRLCDLQDPFPGATKILVVPMRPYRQRQPHHSRLRPALIGGRDRKQRP